MKIRKKLIELHNKSKKSSELYATAKSNIYTFNH